jgi:hypothetical protein
MQNWNFKRSYLGRLILQRFHTWEFDGLKQEGWRDANVSDLADYFADLAELCDQKVKPETPMNQSENPSKPNATWADPVTGMQYTDPTTPVAQPVDSMGMPLSCGKPLCSPGNHHPLCKLATPQSAPSTWEAEMRAELKKLGFDNQCPESIGITLKGWLDGYAKSLNTQPAPTNHIGAVMPCGAVVTNVHEAYAAGKKTSAQLTLVSEGYKLVPVEPTQEMLAAATNYSASTHNPCGKGYYKAMLSTAQPAVPLTEKDIANACLSYRHDFGLMDAKNQGLMMFQAREWAKAFGLSSTTPGGAA